MIVELEAGTGEELTADALGRLGCPTTILVGSRSRELFRDAARRVHAAIPSARVVGVPDGDHLTSILRPEALARAIEQALDDHDRAAPGADEVTGARPGITDR